MVTPQMIKTVAVALKDVLSVLYSIKACIDVIKSVKKKG